MSAICFWAATFSNKNIKPLLDLNIVLKGFVWMLLRGSWLLGLTPNVFNNLWLTDPEEVTKWHLNKKNKQIYQMIKELSCCVINHRQILTMNASLSRYSSDAGEIQRFRATSWMTRTHLNTTRAGQCSRAALHLSATHSPGMRWMTYSVSEVFEPVAQEDKKKETHLRKTSTREEVGVQLALSAAQELKHTHAKFEHAQWMPPADNPVGGVLYRLRCLH